jgi:hypothetical protein
LRKSSRERTRGLRSSCWKRSRGLAGTRAATTAASCMRVWTTDPVPSKRRLAVSGIRQLIAFCQEYAIPHEIWKAGFSLLGRKNYRCLMTCTNAGRVRG